MTLFSNLLNISDNSCLGVRFLGNMPFLRQVFKFLGYNKKERHYFSEKLTKSFDVSKRIRQEIGEDNPHNLLWEL